MSLADDVAIEHGFRAQITQGPLSFSKFAQLQERCALLENQVAQAERALAHERAVSADLSRRLQHVLDRLRAFAAQI